MGGGHEDLTAADEGTDAPVRGAGARRLTVAAVTVAVLAVGGGTYLGVSGVPGWGRSAGGGTAVPANPSLDRATVGPAPSWSGTPGATALPAEPAPAPAGTYRLAGTLPRHGPASAASYHPAGKVSQRDVRQLADALGVPGPVRQEADGWRAGDEEGPGPSLLVGTDAQATWSYASDGGAVPETTGDPVSERQARAAAAPLLGALGLTSARIDASRTAGTSRTVTADPLVGGLPTHGWDTDVTFGPDGRVRTAHGHLAALAKGPTERVVSATQAFRELPGPRLMHPGSPACADEGAGATGGGSDAADTAEPHTKPCAAAQPLQIDITGAEFGLTLTYASGGPRLTPAWLFTAVPHPAGAPSVLPRPATTP